jgi:hypothetical protein
MRVLCSPDGAVALRDRVIRVKTAPHYAMARKRAIAPCGLQAVHGEGRGPMRFIIFLTAVAVLLLADQIRTGGHYRREVLSANRAKPPGVGARAGDSALKTQQSRRLDQRDLGGGDSDSGRALAGRRPAHRNAGSTRGDRQNGASPSERICTEPTDQTSSEHAAERLSKICGG